MRQRKKKIFMVPAVRYSLDKIGGFHRCTAIVTDDAPAMIRGKTGFDGLIRENNVTCPIIHCIIHQEALCGRSVKQSEVFKVVITVINIIRGRN